MYFCWDFVNGFFSFNFNTVLGILFLVVLFFIYVFDFVISLNRIIKIGLIRKIISFLERFIYIVFIF